MKDEGQELVIIGDCNAKLRNLSDLKITSKDCHIQLMLIATQTKTDRNWRYCFDDTCFEGNYTYRKGAHWRFQIDWCFTTLSVISVVISNFQILPEAPVHSVHAAIAVDIAGTDRSLICIKEYACLLGMDTTKCACVKAAQYEGTDHDLLPSNIQNLEHLRSRPNIIIRLCQCCT